MMERDPERAAEDLDDLRGVARGALAEVREAVSGYRRPTLDDELAGARMALEAAGVSLVVARDGELPPPSAESVLAWTIREGTTNVIRHAGASRVELRVVAGAGAATAEVIDDGAGANGSAPGHGLDGLRERAEAVGGHLDAGPLPGGGFRLSVTVPLERSSPAPERVLA
jgi:two-component system, NarL family, sensor histidine kinase DesK